MTPSTTHSKKNPLSMTRRDAMKILGIGTAGMTLGGYKASAQSYGKNETLNIGLIGCGGRMRRALFPGLIKNPGTQVVAVCDVYDDFLNSAHVLVGGRDRKIQKTRHYEELLERKDIDAVVIATPDHWHVPITIDAVEAGKDVYVEKPVTHKLEEGAKLIKAVRDSGRKVQVGAQQRTMPHLVVLKQRLDSGEIDLGEISRIHMQWCRLTSWSGDPNFRITEDQVDWKRFLGNAPDQPFDPLRMRSWRWIWDFGNGPLADLMVHWLDATNWLLNLPMPSQVVMSGGKYQRKGRTETPDLTNCIMEFPERGMQMDFVCGWRNNLNKASTTIMGSKASLFFDRGRYEVLPQAAMSEPAPPPSEVNIGSEGPRGNDFFTDYNGEQLHMADWLKTIREGGDPVDNVEAGVQAAAVCHYGNISYKEKRFVQV